MEVSEIISNGKKTRIDTNMLHDNRAIKYLLYFFNSQILNIIKDYCIIIND